MTNRLASLRPSPSMVVSLIALFISLTGGAYALQGTNTVDSGDIIDRQVKAADLGPAAVTTGKVAANAVTAAKVPANALTGNDISESSLGQVPSAANANTLDSLDSTAFLGTNDSAGGDLTGSFSNLQIGNSTVGSGQVVDNSIAGQDINEPTLAQVPDAGKLDNHDSTFFGPGIVGGLMQSLSATTDRFPSGISTATTAGAIAPTGFVMRDMQVKIANAPGAGDSWTFFFQANGSNGSSTCIISGATATTCSENSNPKTVSAGQEYLIHVSASGTPNATTAQFGWRAVTP